MTNFKDYLNLYRYGPEKGRIPFSRTAAGRRRIGPAPTTTRELVLKMRQQGLIKGDASQDDIEQAIRGGK